MTTVQAAQTKKKVFFRRRVLLETIYDPEEQVLEPIFSKPMSYTIPLSIERHQSDTKSPKKKQKTKSGFRIKEKKKINSNKFPTDFAQASLTLNYAEIQSNFEQIQSKSAFYSKDSGNPFQMYFSKEKDTPIFKNEFISKSLQKQSAKIKKSKLYSYNEKKELLRTDSTESSTFNDHIKPSERQHKILENLKRNYRASLVRRKTSMVNTFYKLLKAQIA